ncbi:Ribosome-releasing factor 2 mitochondrial [Dissostichus eleginoides]|uniref:Ribosome-releasing factor 2 mitochondrial n=1 Tax=Dissostichus eleginoides TaxID=100907 RepID=A0AAD9F5N6_DISEL|nr:Ribosome-releasing factor 2 mitochondrial [Dissostichus eleginoides]
MSDLPGELRNESPDSADVLQQERSKVVTVREGDKPVILVLLHHAYEAKFIPIVQPGRDGANIKLQVNVFFHETKHGLLNFFVFRVELVSTSGEVMTDLLTKIKGENQDVANRLKQSGFVSDSDFRSLTGADLYELMPEQKYLKLRRTIFEMIHKQEPVGQLLREIKNFIPSENFRAALTGKGVLVEYLSIMKDMQTHVKHIQSFQEAQIRFLEENIQSQEPIGYVPPQEAHGDSSDLLMEIRNQERDAADVLQEADLRSDSEIRSLTREELLELFPGPKDFKLRRRIFEIIQNQKPVKQLPTKVNNVIPISPKERFEAVNKRKGKLVYKIVVNGTTFGADFELMEKVKNEVKDQFDLVQSYSNDHNVTIVFCPIVSRMGPDVESAMRNVKGDKPVILVLMHHAYEAKFIPKVAQGANIKLQVNVFFHETKKGLLNCEVMSDLLEKIKEEHQDVAKVLQEADLCTDSDIRPLTAAELYELFPEKKDLKLRRTIFNIIHKQKSLGQLLREMKDISVDFKDALTDNGVLVDNLSILKDMQTHMKDMQSFLDPHISSLEANIQNQPIQESVTKVTKPRDDNGPEGAHDVESAMRDVKGDKPVILILMHHAYEAKFIPKPWRDGADNQLNVNVFFHETKHGLLHCEENRAAACEIIQKLQECPIVKAKGPAAGNSLTPNSRSSSNKTSYDTDKCCVN